MDIRWKPIAATALQERIGQGYARMSQQERNLWDAVRIEPEKWQQHPYGDEGGGFWVVGLIGHTVFWYNDIEEGFNRSEFSTYGLIDGYWSNPDELETAIQYLTRALEGGHDLVRIIGKLRA